MSVEVSVIIPVFNRGVLVKRSIESVLRQTYSEVEVIVADDGSTDSTQEQILQFGDKVRYFYKKNGGVSSARNLGIKKSLGKYIAFLDSDDEFFPEKLAKQKVVLDENDDIDIVLCDCVYVNESHESIGQSRRRDVLPKDGYVLNDVLLAPSFIPSSVLMRKTVFDNVGLFDETLKTAEDIDLFLRIALKFKVALIEEPLFSYMRGNIGLSDLSSTYDDYVNVISSFVRKNQSEIPMAIRKRALFLAYFAFAKGKYWKKEIKTAHLGTLKAFCNVSSLSEMFQLGKMLLVSIAGALRTDQ